MKVVSTLGWILIVIGILGFIPGITTSDGMFLGVFQVDAVHNLVYLIAGILAVVFAKSATKTWGLILGVIFVLLGLIGLFTAGDLLGFIASNAASDWLHIIAGLLFIWGGMKAGKGASSAAM